MPRNKTVDHGMGTIEEIRSFAQETLKAHGVEIVNAKPLVNFEGQLYLIGQEVYQEMASQGHAGKSGVPQLTDMAHEIQKRFEVANPQVVEAIQTKYPYAGLDAEKRESFLRAWDATETSPYHVLYRFVARAVQDQRKSAAKESRIQAAAKAAEAAQTAETTGTTTPEGAEGNAKGGKKPRTPAAAEVAVS